MTTKQRKNLVHETKIKFENNLKLPLIVNYKLYGPIEENEIKFLLSFLRYCNALIKYENDPRGLPAGWQFFCCPRAKKRILQRFGINISMGECTVLIYFCSSAGQLIYSFPKDLYKKLRIIIPLVD